MNFEMEIEKMMNDICNKKDARKEYYECRIYYYTAFRNNKQFKAFGGRYEPFFKKWYLVNGNPNVEEVDALFTRMEFDEWDSTKPKIEDYDQQN